MPDIYRSEWVGNRTGHSYRLDICAASATPLGGSPTIEALDKGAIKEMSDWGWEDRDKIPYGMPSAMSGTIIFKPTRCPSTLLDWLIDGITSISADIYVGASTHTVTFDSGVVFYLYIKPATSTTYTLCASCVQDVTQDTFPDPITDTLEITVGDTLQLACKALTFAGEGTNAGIVDADWDGITDADPDYAGVNAKTAVVDWVWKGGTDWFYVAHVPPGREDDNDDASCFWSVKAETMAGRWSAYVQAIVRAVTRRTTSVNISYALITSLSNLYKQSHSTSGLTSSTLTTAELRWLFFACNDNAISPATTRNFAMHDVLAIAYDNLWDFLYDMPGSRFKRWWITHREDGSIDTGIRCLDPFGAVFTAIDVTSELRDPKVSVRGSAVVSRVEAQTEFGLADDYTNETAKAPSSRNNTSMDVPVIFDSSPVADEYVLASAMSTGYFTDRDQEVRDRLQNMHRASIGTTDVQGSDGAPIGNPRFLGLYYLQNPTDGGIGDAFHFDGGLIRCHAWQPFVIYGVADSPPGSTPVVLSSTRGSVGGAAMATISQQVHGSIAQLPNKVFDEYYSVKSTFIEATVPLDFGAYIDTTGAASQFAPFAAVIRPFTVDPTTFASYMSALPTQYYMSSCKFDFQTELMEITLWGK